MDIKNAAQLPLRILNDITRRYPKAWDIMEDFHVHNGIEGLPQWPSWCYAPMSAALAIVGPLMSEQDLLRITDAQCIAALAPWRKDKEIFVIDPDLQNALFAQNDDLELPTDILLHLPYQAFYVQFHDLTIEDNTIAGTFVHLEYDVNTQEPELRFLFVHPDGSVYGYPIHLTATTILENVQRVQQIAYQNVPPNWHKVRRKLMIPLQWGKTWTRFVYQILQVILYLCSENTDITPNIEQKTIMHRHRRNKDTYAELCQWDVGIRVGNALRKSVRPSNTDETIHTPGTHATPRPHMRRGHWQHYWVGPKHQQHERKLVLRWIAPITVGSLNDGPVVVQKISIQNKK